MDKKKLKDKLKKKLQEIESREKNGYIFNGNRFLSASDCGISELFVHFKKKEYLKKRINKLIN